MCTRNPLDGVDSCEVNGVVVGAQRKSCYAGVWNVVAGSLGYRVAYCCFRE